MPFTPIPAGPPVPNSEDPENTFDEQYEASMIWQRDVLAPGVNAAVEEINDSTAVVLVAADQVAADAAAAAAFAASAMNAPGTSATSATSLGVSIGSKSFMLQQLGKDFTTGQSVVVSRQADALVQMIGKITAFVPGTGAMTVLMTTADGSGTFTDWSVALGMAAPSSSAPPLVTREQRSTVTALDSNDNGKVIGITAAIVQTILAQAGLPDGWHVELRNEFNGDFTIDPNGSELIDGQATVTVKAGYALELNWKSGVMRTKVVKVRPPMGWAQLALVTSNSSETIGPDTYVRREYAVGAGSAGGYSSRGAGGGMAYGDLPVKPGDTLTRTISSGVATVAVNGVTMLTANPASGATAGTASKHASVTNGGAYSGGAGGAAAGGGASSGSPLGVGVAGTPTASNGGSGWGGPGFPGVQSGGGGTASAGVTGKGGTAVSAVTPSAEPLLALLNGTPGQGFYASGGDFPGGDGGPGAGGGPNHGGSAKAGKGGMGGGGGGGGNTGGDGGFGGGGGAASSTGGAGGYGGGGATGGTTFGAGGAAAFLYFKEA